MITYAARLFQSPSLLIFGSGSWPPREGLLSPAARRIYTRNFIACVASVSSRAWFV